MESQAGKKGTNESIAVCVSSRTHGYVICSTSFEVEDCKPDLTKRGGHPHVRYLPGETYGGALVFTIKMLEELVEASLRDQVVFREREALRIKWSGLNTNQRGSMNIPFGFFMAVDGDSRYHQ